MTFPSIHQMCGAVHDAELADIKRINALSREAASMYVLIQKLHRSAARGGVKNDSVIAEVARIVAVVEGTKS